MTSEQLEAKRARARARVADPVYKARKAEYDKIYNKARNANPEWVAKRAEYDRVRNSRPEAKEAVRKRRSMASEESKLEARQRHTDLARLRRSKNPAHQLHIALKARSKRFGVPFAMTYEFLDNKPTHCPHCKILMDGSCKKQTASVDRADPKLGYVDSNCEWLCMGCNMRKYDHSWAEMLEFAARGLARMRDRLV